MVHQVFLMYDLPYLIIIVIQEEKEDEGELLDSC